MDGSLVSKVKKPWGHYTILYEDFPKMKVKELYVEPNKELSLQKHSNRSEHWTVICGEPTVALGSDQDFLGYIKPKIHEHIEIPVGHWHQLSNQTDYLVKILEIQYGSSCEEEDIERI